MDPNSLVFALKISGIGIVVLLLVLVLLAGVVWLMTKFISEKPETEEGEESEPLEAVEVVKPSKSNADLQVVAAIALALNRAQTETQSIGITETTGEMNIWKQFNLQRRLNQSSNIRRSR